MDSWRDHFKLLLGIKNTLVPRALFHWGQQGRGIRNQCSKMESKSPPALAHTQSYCQHQAEKSWPSHTGWPITWNGQLIHQKWYILGNILGQIKKGSAWAGETFLPFSQKTEQGSHYPNYIEDPSIGMWRWHRQCCQELEDPLQDFELIKKKKKKKKTKTETDPEREVRKQTPNAEVDSKSFFFRICVFFLLFT